MFRPVLVAVTFTTVFSAHSASTQSHVLRTPEVDLELVLAADASGSISSELAQAQKLAFAEAFEHPDLQAALVSGPLGKVAVVYFEWAGEADQHIVVPWTVLEGINDIQAFADRLRHGPSLIQSGETSISGAMLFASDLLNTNGVQGLRTVVDIASNGRNSDGPPVSVGLEALGSTGTVVNALVLPGRGIDQIGPYASLFSAGLGPMSAYFKKEVIDGPGSFVQEVDPDVGFSEAILRKLVMEVAWATD